MTDIPTRLFLNEWQADITEWGRSKGWDQPPLAKALGERIDGPLGIRDIDPMGVNVEAVLAKLALCHTELSEAVEAVRDGKYAMYITQEGKPDGMAVELADTMIRILHLGGLLGLDLEAAMEAKMDFNRKRPYRHGGRSA